MPKLLFIDDDIEILEFNKRFFTNKGYDVKVAADASEGIKILSEFKADCILLDIMMPGMNGFQAIRKIRANVQIPIIILSGCSLEEDKIKGLMLGADDYMIKPYSLRELEARVVVQIRRLEKTTSQSSVLSCPPLMFDLVKHKAFYNLIEIPLSNREYELIYLLAAKANEIVTFEEIGEHIWGIYSDTDRRAIMVMASRVRKKLSEYIGLTDFIETVWSKGYKFIGRIR